MKHLLDPGDFPSLPGAYCLLLTLANPQTVTLPRGDISELESGIYLYAGSAKGPGGIRARVLRHINANKRRHWHIDQLADRRYVIGILGYYELGECDFISRASRVLNITFPVKGFGSSDCRECYAHLLQIKNGAGLSDIAKKLNPDVMWSSPHCAFEGAL